MRSKYTLLGMRPVKFTSKTGDVVQYLEMHFAVSDTGEKGMIGDAALVLKKAGYDPSMLEVGNTYYPVYEVSFAGKTRLVGFEDVTA